MSAGCDLSSTVICASVASESAVSAALSVTKRMPCMTMWPACAMPSPIAFASTLTWPAAIALASTTCCSTPTGSRGLWLRNVSARKLLIWP
ncbi:hypothetical protein [Ottowia sp.]|uniref:hypothetical protein n=1 Tax=Ottowia sp. TaxID=1898956 RepID=UPI0039624A29